MIFLAYLNKYITTITQGKEDFFRKSGPSKPAKNQSSKMPRGK